MKKYRRILCMLTAGIALLSTMVLTASATQKQTIYNSPYVTFAPDGMAWTTNAGERDMKWYEKGTTVSTGIVSDVRVLQTGEHYYLYDRTGEIPIGRWEISLGNVNCCHNNYPSTENYHSISYAKNNCFQNHYSGWFPYCADCGELVGKAYVYMSKEAAESIDYFQVSEGFDYYYLCPFCNNLEQGVSVKGHECKAISYNQYKVIYDANVGMENNGGFMPNSYHMYNNATEYNGEPVTPITHLTKNAYTRVGFEFVEWNTEPDGSGTSYHDGQEILNLTDKDHNVDEEGGEVTLYAQWRKSTSTLHIDPNGGSYNGKAYTTVVTGSFGNSYKITGDTIIPPKGYTVSFHTNGGSAIPSVTSTMHFTDWSMVSPFNGRMQTNIYHFIAPDGNTDTIVANYEVDSVTLPSATKPGNSFGGWCYDSECTKPAGGPGDKITPSKDITLYASWVDLKLFSEDNYTANDGKGAVDLSWSQSDNNSKTYKIYQSRDNTTWKLITSASDIGNQTAVSEGFNYSGSGKTYTAPYSGIYTLTAYGAQGGNYGIYKGGNGGSVKARVWLEKGEILTYNIGGQNGYNGGGAGSAYGNGGGATTVVSDRQGTLLIAGGGGGASASGGGGAGGASTSLRSDKDSLGASGMTGGGAGHVGGNAGEYIVHTCSDSCFHSETINVIAGQNFYAGGKMGTTGSVLTPSHTYGSNFGQVFATGIKYATTPVSTTLTTGNNSAYLSTPAEGILSFSISTNPAERIRGTYDKLNFVIMVYDKDTNAVLYQIDAMTASHTESTSTAAVCNQSASCTIAQHKQTTATWVYNTPYMTGTNVNKNYLNFQNHNGNYCGFERQDVMNLRFNIPIDEKVNGVYIEAKATISGDVASGGSSNLTYKIYDAAFSYLKRTKICGYEDGQIISSKPAYGGSNYINTSVAHEYSQSAGVRAGNGTFSIKSELIGYLDTHSLQDVIATDFTAPESISAESVTREAMSDTQVRINWQEPKDKGTDYYHVAESYLVGNAEPLCRSNVTKNTLIAGVEGYYVLADANTSTVVTALNSNFITTTSQEIEVGDQVKYLHVAAVDKAGNIGKTTHIKIEAKDVAWKLYTEQLSIEEGENVYPVGEKKWYVRADGNAPFTLKYNSYMDGAATAEYQPNYIIYESVTEGIVSKNVVYTPSMAIREGEVKTTADGLTHSAEGRPVLTQYPYSFTLRTEQGRRLQGVQSFTLISETAGKEVEVIPVMGADWNGEIIYSNHDADRRNGLTIIGDAQAPVVNGIEILENVKLINRNEGTVMLNAVATDDLSGVKEFYVEITNTDNANSKTYIPGEDGSIRIEITKNEPIFNGDFVVRIYAADYVGNETEAVYTTTEFALSATLERILEPHAPIFKCGESGVLTVTTYGYADKVEVIFPEAMAVLQPELNQIFDYRGKESYMQEEKLQFMIPLNTPENAQYTITVRAYKGDKRMEEHPTFSTIAIDGSVLDELRTRLR